MLLALSKPLLAVMFFLDGSLPYPTATVSSIVLPNTTSQSTDVLTSVTSSTGQHTQHAIFISYVMSLKCLDHVAICKQIWLKTKIKGELFENDDGTKIPF